MKKKIIFGSIFLVIIIFVFGIFKYKNNISNNTSFKNHDNDEYIIINEFEYFHNDNLKQVIDVLASDTVKDNTVRFITLSDPDEYFTVNGKITGITGYNSIESAPVNLSESDEFYTRIRFLRPGYFGVITLEKTGIEQFYSVFVSPVSSKHVDLPVTDFDWYHCQFNLEIGSASNCGPAAASMAVGWGAGIYFPISKVREHIGWRGDGGTSFEELLNVIKSQGVSAFKETVTTVQDLIEVIDSSSIAVILYSIEGIKYNPNYADDFFGAYYVDHGGHYLVIKGYSLDKKYFVIHDPIPSNWRTNDFRYQDGITMAGKNRYYNAQDLINSLRKHEMIVVRGLTLSK